MVGDPLAWVELFALSNVAFLAADIALAHAVNAFAHPAEYVPVAFSLVAPAVLVAAMALGGLGRRWPEVVECPPAGRGLGLAVGWGSVAVGIAGVLFHLDSAFFDEQTLQNLVYTAPFAAPLADTGIGLRSSSTGWWIRGPLTGHAGSSGSHWGASRGISC